MIFSLRRYSVLLLALILTASLAACSSTSTTSGASRATRSSDAAAAEQQPADDVQESSDAAQSTAAPSDTQAPIEPAVVQQLDAESDDVSMDAVPETGAVEESVVFPEQRYAIDAEDAAESDSEAEAEIERLRRELAATESELDRMREEQAQPDYDSSQAGSSAGGAESDGASTDEGPQDDYADASVAGAPDDADAMGGAAADGTDGARGTSRVGNDEADLSGKPAEFSIYFGYDETSFHSRFEPVIVAHAEFLMANPGLKVEIQGNCDERGSREYNIALGQRRAEAVKRALELLGVQGSRIDTVSFGAEKPVAFGQDEDSYRLNRRADIVY